MKDCRILFLPQEISYIAPEGTNLLTAAMEAGVHINAYCGGAGACGKCRVIVKSGAYVEQPSTFIPPEDYARGVRLACLLTVKGDLTVEIPPESRLNLESIARQKERVAAKHLAPALNLKILAAEAEKKPAFSKFHLRLDPPTPADNKSDLSRLLHGLNKNFGLDKVSVDFHLLSRLPHILRAANWEVTATVVQRRVEAELAKEKRYGARRPRLTNVEPGDSSGEHYAVSFDVGTTSLWGHLLDLNRGEEIAEASAYNPQISCGEDVITRIIYSQRKGGLKRLRELAVGSLNELIDEMLKSSGVKRESITHISAAGNTVMTHLLLGLDPKYLREDPYTPVANFIPPVRAVDLGFNVAEHVFIYTFPSVASYVGGDIVSGVLASGFYRQDKLTLYIDIGTNGEIVLGNKEWMLTASCSAGPAFEGGGLAFGMRAAKGAIEEFEINPETLEPMLLTIGRELPRGICGSAIIDIMAEFLKYGIIHPNGKFNASLKSPRLRKGESGLEYILSFAEKNALGKDITFSEVDIDNILRAKAAMFAGYDCLLAKAGLSFAELEEVIIAGAFGSHVDLANAVFIGLLPELPLDRFKFIGNGSLLGAKLILLSNELLDDGERISRMMTNVELSVERDYMDRYLAAMFLPHTREELFPATQKVIKANRLAG